jgi:hypothetical protein
MSANNNKQRSTKKKAHKMDRIVLLFKSDVVINMEPCDKEEEKEIEKLLKPVMVKGSKQTLPCG